MQGNAFRARNTRASSQKAFARLELAGDVSADVGIFGAMMLWPSYQRSKKNPDDKKLRDVLPPATYARWQAAKARYLGRDPDVEDLRPVHAAKTLFDAAVRQVGLTGENPCLEQTLDRLDVDLHTMVTRANAWAEGDVEKLHALPFNDQKQACLGALANNGIARAQGIDNLDAEVLGSWMKSLHASLASHDVIFATMPIGRLEGNGGVLAALRAEGFSVQAPE